MAVEAKRRGFRVVAFTFAEEAPGLAGAADRIRPSSLADIAAVLRGLEREGVSAALFSGKFWKRDLFGARPDETGEAIVATGGGGLDDAGLVQAVITTLAGLGIEVLDQRVFLADGMAAAGPLGRRVATAAEHGEIDRGFAVARALARAGVGQTVVLRRGAVASIEAAEGTTESIRRGLGLAGPHAVVVKAVAPDNDYRFDLPSVGPETLEVMAAGRAGTLAVEAGAVLVLERDRCIELADRADIAFVGIEGPTLPGPGRPTERRRGPDGRR
jgi:DUF1009 family protein